MAAPIGGLSNAKWRDDKAIIEINAEQADKRLANVLAEQEKKNKQSNDPLAYVHSGVENRMELWDRRNLGKLFRKARGTYQTTPVHMGRIPDRSPMHSGAVPPKHTKEEYERAHNFYQDHYDTLQHKELAKRLLVEDEKPAWQSRLEKSLMSPTKMSTKVDTLEKSVETRFTQDSVEIQLRRAEKWVARPLGPRPDCPWRIVACVADVGMGFSGAANLAGALDDLAEVSALCVPGRLHRGDEDVGDGPEPEYEKKEDEDPLQRFSVVTNEPKPEQSELRKWARDAHDALHALGFFDDERPWMLYGHGVGAVLAYELVRRIIAVDEDPRSPLLPRRLVVSGCPPPALFGGPPGPPPADHPSQESNAPPPLPLGKRDDIALLFYACRLRAGRDPNEQPPLSDDDRDEEPPPEHLEQWQAVQWPEVQRLRRRRALNQYRLQDLPGPLKESAALRRVAAKGVRRDYRLLESHVHDADWPLKIPITALAGEHDLSVSDENLREWETETARDFQYRRVLGGSSYPREPAGVSSLADLLRGACEEFREEAESSDDEGRRKVVPEPGPWSLADYYPESEASEEETVEAKEGFEAMLAASEKARKQLQLRCRRAAPAPSAVAQRRMGNDVAKNCANRMAIGAMSNVTDLERPVIQRMSEKLADIAKREGSKDLVTKEEFGEALNGLEITQSDRDILDRIFVMLDRTGEDRINHKEFIVGIVPFALGKTEELIQMAFELFTNNASDRVTPMDLRFILMTLNTVASYFGDPVMTVAQVDKVVDDAADKLDPPPKSGELLMAELSPYVADHEFVHEFVEGKGTSRYGNKL